MASSLPSQTDEWVITVKKWKQNFEVRNFGQRKKA